MNNPIILIVSFLIQFSHDIAMGNNVEIKIEYTNTSELILTRNNKLDTEQLFYYDTSLETTKKTSVDYKKWTPINSNCKPTFYSIENQNNENPVFHTYYLRNQKFIKSREQLINNNFSKDYSYRYWSMSYQRRILWNSAFNLNIFNSREFFHENDHDNNIGVITSYFENDHDFINNMIMLDLSDSIIHKRLFDEIAILPKLEILILPIEGSPLSHPNFKANHNVRELTVHNTVLNNNILDKISNFENLKKLTLIGCAADQFYYESNESLNKLFKQLKTIEIINCRSEVISILDVAEWIALENGVFDFIPNGIAAKNLLSNVGDKNRLITIIVDENTPAAFKSRIEKRIMIMFELSD